MAGYYDRDRNVRGTNGQYSSPSDATVAPIMNHPMTHHGNVAEYQASGIPFLYKFTTVADTVHTITFPYVTQWVQIILDDNKTMMVGYSKEGLTHSGGSLVGAKALTGTNHIIINTTDNQNIGNVWRWKTNQLAFVSGAAIVVTVVAGLTNVPSTEFPDLTNIVGLGSDTGIKSDYNGT